MLSGEFFKINVSNYTERQNKAWINEKAYRNIAW